MQIEIPTFAKTPSVRSLFDAVIHVSGQSRKFSFSGARSFLSFPATVTSKDIDLAEYESIPVSILPNKTPQEAQTEVIEKLVSHVVGNLMVDDLENEKSCFIGSAVPPITLLDYMERLVKYVSQWDEDVPNASSAGVRCCLVALEYLERTKVRVTPRSVHRYFMIAVLVAIKTTEDFAISNKFWGDVGGCRLDDVNRMEIAFCQLMRWNLTVTPEQYARQQTRFDSS